MTKNDLYQEIYAKYGFITRAQNCFLYTHKNQRLTDMFQENGKAILGWDGKNSTTFFKNMLSKGLTGGFVCEDKARIDKAVARLIGKECKVFFYNNKADAVKAAQVDAAGHLATFDGFRKYAVSQDAAQKALAGKEHINREVNEPQLGLFPVWFLSYRTKKDRVAYAVVNAENGEISADLPVSVGKYVLFSLIIAAPIFALLAFFFTLTPGWTLGLTAALAVISLIVYAKEISELKKRHLKYDDKGFYEKYGPKQDKEELKKIAPVRGALGSIFAIAIVLIVLRINPVDDFYFYGAAIAAIIGVCITMSAIIRRYNILMTRPSPKFYERKGGDDSARDR